MEAAIKCFGECEVPNPFWGDMRLTMFPIGSEAQRTYLPPAFDRWQPTVNRMLRQIPIVSSSHEHFVTIDSKFFGVDEPLRREGIHIDGNFCGDPNFKGATWGGTTTTWSGVTCENAVVSTPWVSESRTKPPIGEYVSSEKGGIFCASSLEGCQAWVGDIAGYPNSGGCCDHLKDELEDNENVVLEKNKLYFMSSNTPHETLTIKKGNRRTLVRLTLDHRYPNERILN